MDILIWPKLKLIQQFMVSLKTKLMLEEIIADHIHTIQDTGIKKLTNKLRQLITK